VEDGMTLHRLAKDENGSVTSGGCPALYSTDDPARMIGQGKQLSATETAELLELLEDETAVAIPTGTVFRGAAKYATEHGDDDLAGRIETFLAAQGL
jgi:hypothetical protein